MSQEKQRFVVNDAIKAEKVFLLDKDNQNKGIMSRKDAITLAQQQELDLVAIDLRQEPPVCKIADLGKLQYQQEKRFDKPKKNSAVKEIRFRPITEKHDLERKVNQINGWLEEGHKVKINMIFEGREISHQEVARNVWAYLKEHVQGDFEKDPKLEGRTASAMVNHRPVVKNKPKI